MFLLDTNVLSEAMKPAPAGAVLNWLEQQQSADVWTTAITEAEILYGIAILPDGKRKQDLAGASRAVLALFAGRILSFDSQAALTFAQIVSDRRAAGTPIGDFDAMIAAIALARGMTVATRNVSDFEGLGLPVINPWAS